MCICHVAKLFSFVDLALINYLAKPIVAQVVGYTTTNDYIYPAQVGCVNVISGNGQLATYGIDVGRQQPTSQLILCTELGSCELIKVLKIISVQFIFLFFFIVCYYFVDQFFLAGIFTVQCKRFLYTSTSSILQTVHMAIKSQHRTSKIGKDAVKKMGSRSDSKNEKD